VSQPLGSDIIFGTPNREEKKEELDRHTRAPRLQDQSQVQFNRQLHARSQMLERVGEEFLLLCNMTLPT